MESFGGSRLRAPSVLLLTTLSSTSAWVSTTQARFGTTIEVIRDESLGNGVGTSQASLGYLWTQPLSTTDPRGLGGSIAWAFDERLCNDLPGIFEEHFWSVSLVSCASIKASVHRAFDTWAMNSRHIKFTDASEHARAGYGRRRGVRSRKYGSRAWQPVVPTSRMRSPSSRSRAPTSPHPSAPQMARRHSG